MRSSRIATRLRRDSTQAGHPAQCGGVAINPQRLQTRGELLALAWPDVALEYRSITIRKSLEQTKAGLRIKETKGRNVRTVTLPVAAIDALKRVRASQDKNRELFGPDYQSDLNLVFCYADGNYIRPGTV